MTHFDASRIRSIFVLTATAVLFLAAFCLTASADDEKRVEEAEATAIKELQGKWLWLSFERDGRQIPINEGDYMLIEGTNVSIRRIGPR